jgi:hypothetical protein
MAREAAAQPMLKALRCAVLSLAAAGACAEELPRGLDFPGADVKKLTLGEAIEMTLRNNLDVQFSKVDIKIEQARTRFAIGVYDPVFRLEASRESIQRPDITSNLTTAESLLQQAQILAIEANTRAIQEASGCRDTSSHPPEGRIVVFDQDADRFESNLTFRTPLGTQIAAVARQAKIRSTFDGDPRTITPFYQAFGGFEVRQPLLKDFGPAANLSDIRQSRINEQVSLLTWEKSLNDALASVLGNLLRHAFRAGGSAGETGRGRGGRKAGPAKPAPPRAWFHVSDRRATGARPSSRSTRSNSSSRRTSSWSASFLLRRLITNEGRTGGNVIFLPVQIPALIPPETSREELLVTAFRKRPDYTAAVTDAEKQDIRLKFAKNQTWPNLDLVGSFGYNGLGEHWESARDAAQVESRRRNGASGFNSACPSVGCKAAPNWMR